MAKRSIQAGGPRSKTLIPVRAAPVSTGEQPCVPANRSGLGEERVKGLQRRRWEKVSFRPRESCSRSSRDGA